LDLGTSVGAAESATSAQVRVTHASGSIALDTVVVMVNGSVTIGPLEIPLESPDEMLTAKVDLLAGSNLIFTGTSTIQAVAGQVLSTTVELDPVVAEVVVEGPLPVFTAIGDDASLVGYALFSNGDTVPGSPLEWTSDDPGVVVVQGNAVLVATGEGSTTVRGGVGDRFGTLQAVVEAVVVTVVIDPQELILPRGNDVQITGRAEDANGNALTRQIDWTSMDPLVAAVDATGVVTGVNPGGTTLVAEVGDVMGSATIEVTPAPPGISAPQVATPGTRTVGLSADINPNGAATIALVQWSTTAGFEAPLSAPETSVGDGLDGVAIEETLTRLTPSTTYFVRIAATNAYGETVTEAVEITTMDPSGGFVDGMLSAEGEPVEGAMVQLDDGPTTLSDAAGFYSFDDVEVGQHQIKLVELPLGVVFQTPQAAAEITQIGDSAVLHVANAGEELSSG